MKVITLIEAITVLLRVNNVMELNKLDAIHGNRPKTVLMTTIKSIVAVASLHESSAKGCGNNPLCDETAC